MHITVLSRRVRRLEQVADATLGGAHPAGRCPASGRAVGHSPAPSRAVVIVAGGTPVPARILDG